MGEVGERAGTYAGLAMPVRMEEVENLEEVGGEGDDAREGGVSLWEKQGAREGEFVGRFANGWADKGRSESLWKS